MNKRFVRISVAEQRKRYSDCIWLSACLELILRQLVRETLEGNLQSAASFQQLIQYAPESMKMRIDSYITAGAPTVSFEQTSEQDDQA